MLSTLKKPIALISDHDEMIARWVSHVISPHVVGIVLTSAAAVRFDDNPTEVILWLLAIIPVLVLPPLFYLMHLVRHGKLEDIYMPDRVSRLVPLAVTMGWLLMCQALLHYWQAPLIVEVCVASTLLLVGVLSLVTLFWKISFHGATISAAAMSTVLVAGMGTWPLLLLIPLVGWSRVRLERHTPPQVVIGSLVGAVVAVLLVHGIVMQLFS